MIKLIKYLMTFNIFVIKFFKYWLKGLIKLKLPFPEKTSTNLIILANGPSLSNYLEKIERLDKDERLINDIMVVNFFPFQDSFNKIKPNYLTLADPGFWRKESSDLAKDMVNKLFEILKSVDWDLKIFIPLESNENNTYFKELESKNPHIKIYNYTSIWINSGFDKLNNYFFKHGITIPCLQNVLVGCIYLSILMKYNEVRILGGDHSWIKELVVDDKNIVGLTDRHFYGSKLRPFFADESGTITFNMSEVMALYQRLFTSYNQLEKLAKIENVKIFNCSQDSYIDAFEKIDFNIKYNEQH